MTMFVGNSWSTLHFLTVQCASLDCCRGHADDKCELPFHYVSALSSVTAVAMNRSRNPPQKGQGAARAKQVNGASRFPFLHHPIHPICCWILWLWIALEVTLLFQMGLLLDLTPDAGVDDSGGNEEELEAELLALIGGGGRGGLPGKKEGGKGEKHHWTNTGGITDY